MAKTEYAHMTNFRHGTHVGSTERKKRDGEVVEEGDAAGTLGPQGWGEGRITEPWNPRLILVGKDLKDHFIPSLWHGQGCHPLDQVAQIILSAHDRDPHLDTGNILVPQCQRGTCKLE